MMRTTDDDTIPAVDCPPWCNDPKPHPWEPDGLGWQRMHTHRVSDAWDVSQVVWVNSDGTLEYGTPALFCSVQQVDTLEDGHAVAAELARALAVLRQAIGGGSV